MKRWELVLVVAVSIGMAFMLLCVLTDYEKVLITRKSPRIETAYDFDPNNQNRRLNPIEKIDPDATAATSWDFGSGCRMNYEVESCDESPGYCQVRLKIKRIHVTLSLPINVHLPKGANERVKQHEDGHVQIAKRIYEQADPVARKAAGEILKRDYTGSGKTREYACQEALQLASSELADFYQSETLTVTHDISEIYDLLQRDERNLPSKSVEEAFKIYQSGKPRRISNNKSTPGF